MEWSFRLLMAFAGALAVVAIDHHLMGGALTGALAGAARALF
jgi:hypothetical protein